jgi:HAD superfamily hydrolase (TIGR01509 family)
MDEKGLGKRLQTVRRDKGFTQQSLCHAANLSYSTLAKIERGAIKAPSIFTIQSIAAALGVGLDELMGSHARGVAAHRQRTKSGASFIFFDVNSTLVYATQRGFTILAERSGVLPDIIESTYWHYNEDVCRGTMSVSDLNKELSQRLGIQVDWQQIYLECAEPIKPMRELLQWAARHYQVGLLSNAMPGFLSGLQRAGVLPDLPYAAIIDSSEIGAIKPEATMYQAAQKAAGVPAEELLAIDDTRGNLMAAEKQGWHVAWFDGYQAETSAERLRQVLEPAV